MNKFLLNLMENTGGSLTFEQVLTNFFAALVLGACVYVSYRLSHAGPVYSPRFNASLVMLAIITTMVMNVIGNNIALSLGMVGALSIVRFRTAIKDPRDTVYIFWCIAIGVCCGVSEYYVPAAGTGVLFVLMLLLGAVKSNDRYLLIIHASAESEDAVEKAVETLFSKKAHLRVKNSKRDAIEVVYELSRSLIRNKAGEQSVNKAIMKVDGVGQVNLVMQSEEVAR